MLILCVSSQLEILAKNIDSRFQLPFADDKPVQFSIHVSLLEPTVAGTACHGDGVAIFAIHDFFSMSDRNSENSGVESCGPGEASG
jgi:hypothetical protein